MSRAVIITLLLSVATALPSSACSCFGPLNFCETVHSNNPDLVALAVKKTNLAHGMEVEVLEVLKGAESRQQVMVWGDNGLLCRHFASRWSVGDTMIFSLDLIGQWGLPVEDSTDYLISVCGTYFLDYAGGQVTGPTNGVDTVMSYSAFKNSMASCVTAIDAPAHPLSGLRLYPNPADARVEIALPPSWTSPVRISVFSISGSELMPATLLHPAGGVITLRTTSLPSGLSLLKIEAGEHIVFRKVVIR